MSDYSTHKTCWSLLAAWRFALASTVALGHYFLMVRPDARHLFRADLLNPTSAVFGFFILSGYSIAASLEREESGFYARRVWRIWPLYLAALAFGLAVQHAMRLSATHVFVWPLGERTPGATVGQIAASLLMLQSVVGAAVSFDGPLWSLSPEWWHYMIAPHLRKLPTVMLAALVLASFVAYLVFAPTNAGIDTLADWRVLALTSWLWVTGFLYFRLRRTPFGFTVLALPSTLALALGRNYGLPLLFTLFVLSMSTEVKLPAAASHIGNWLGDVSYPLYLFHLPAMLALLGLGVHSGMTFVAAPMILAVLSLHLIDRPLRERFLPRARSRAAQCDRKTKNAEATSGALAVAENAD